MPPPPSLHAPSQQYLHPSSSQPQLRVPSFSSGTSTPTLTALHLPKNEPKTLTGKIRHAFDKPKTADFGVKVMVHSMGDIPQNQGVFVVTWKFNGRPPHGRAGDLKPKSSLPDIRLQHASTPPAASTVSLSTNSSVASSPDSRYPPSLSMTSTVATPGSLPPSPRAIKKSTDPTPLRNSTGPEILDKPLATSPASSASELMPQADVSDGTQRTRGDSGTSESIGSTQSSPASSRSLAGLDGVYPSALPANRQSSSTSAKLSSTATASVPFPRPNSGLPPMRSGTVPSPAVLLNCNSENLAAMRPPTITRTSSSVSLSSESNAPATSKSRSRIFSNPAGHKHESTPNSSSSRKGETPARKVASHACEYMYSIQHTIRIPLGKSVAASGASTPGKQAKAPLLGNGPLSESGLSIHIYEIQTQFTNSTNRPTNDESAACAAHDRHVAKHHPERNASDSKEKKEKGEKVLYGYINIDLAPFAGKGEVTRSYLLMGSKTNASLRVSVEMTQKGGDTFYAAPPLSEGHHVTGIHDLIGDEAQTINRDLSLARNSSNSSTGSSLSGAHTAQSRSVTSLHLPQARSTSHTHPKSQYQTYEHHLKPSSEATKRSTTHFGMGKKASKEVLVTPPDVPEHTTESPDSNTAHKHHHKHHHHSVHLRHPYQRGYSQGFRGINELSPEAIIEAVFNPRPAAEEGPMTYVPGPGPRGINGRLQHEEEIIRGLSEKQVGKDTEGGEVREGEKTGKMWARMKQRAYTKGLNQKREKEPSTATA